jgi:bifunctional ADP-heptose synthase (sugar kinase/adenylyltransferase)
VALKFEMPSWAKEVESVNVRPAANGWVVSIYFAGAEPKGNGSRRYQEETYLFPNAAEMSTFVEDATKAKKAN